MHKSTHHILIEGKSENADQEQRQELLSLFHRSELEYELKNHLLDDLTQTEASTHEKYYFDELFDKFWNNRQITISKAQSPNNLLIRLSQLAAILVIGLLIGYFLNSTVNFSSPVYYTSVAPKGSVSEMILPDATHIFLNSGSEIKYTIDGTDGMREIFLSGEAWFQVAKNKEKPFLVHTSCYDVQVTGTSFNVKAYPDDKESVTTLEEGCIHVKSSKNTMFSNEITLKPGEQLVYNKESKDIRVAEVNTKWFTSWKDNKLVFVNMSLADLRILLERKYGVEIEIGDKNILDYHYDGTLKSETILEVLEILKRTLPIQYKIEGQKVIITNK